MNNSTTTEFLDPSDDESQSSSENIELGHACELPKPAEDIDLDAIALPQSFSDLAAVQTDAALKIQKPLKQTWFAPHPDQKLLRQFATMEDHGDFKAIYVLNPTVLADLKKSDWESRILVPCITRQGTLFLWPIRLPDDEGKLDSWSRSALEIAISSGGEWIRISSSQEAQSYISCKPVTPLPAPVWPDDISGLIKKAAVQRLISSKDHPFLKRLRGDI